jgi:hypothetical protein
MISPEQIRDRAHKLWSSGRALRAWLGAEPLFPYSVPFRKPSAKEWLENFARLRVDVERLEATSKARIGAGYTVAFREVTHQKLGSMRTPERIVFESAEDIAACAGENATLRRFQDMAKMLHSREPRLTAWLAEQPLRALEHYSVLPRLLAVTAYFQAHPRPMRYARELDIPGVDSKFVEEYQALLDQWLERLLPAAAMNGEVHGLSDHGFERRFGLRYEEPLIRFRWLDPSLAPAGHIIDATVPLSQFVAYAPTCSQVFVTENKINFLTLPESRSGLAIFGGGYAIERLASIPWLRSIPLYYWGDIDTHGFAILSLLRSRLPQTRSFLMDRDTIFIHQEFWSEESQERRCLRELASLTAEESSLYDDLRSDRLGVRVRLEQERIGYTHVGQAMHTLAGL